MNKEYKRRCKQANAFQNSEPFTAEDIRRIRARFDILCMTSIEAVIDALKEKARGKGHEATTAQSILNTIINV